jgi:hypothetical protein
VVLDAIVEDPDLVWLGTAEQKAAHLLALTRIEQADLPHVSVGEGQARTVRYFPDRLPMASQLSQAPAPVRSAMLWRPGLAGWRSLNSATATVISLPWLRWPESSRFCDQRWSCSPGMPTAYTERQWVGRSSSRETIRFRR